MPSLWSVLPADPPAADRLARRLEVDPITAQLLLNRGATTPEAAVRFLNPSLGALEDPFALPGMAPAVARLRRAIRQREPILVFGDSDVDGLTASVVLTEVLESLGAAVEARQANRILEGYGIPDRLIRRVARSAVQLVVLVDCGTNQAEAVGALSRAGIDTIIVDHHVPIGTASRPQALVNPHAGGTATTPYASAGLAFKVAQALVGEAGAALERWVDLAALGTIADCVPLTGDNRTLVACGLPRILASARPGLQALGRSTGMTAATVEHVARRLVPRLNASGRLGDAGAVWHALHGAAPQQLAGWLAAIDEAHTAIKGLHQEVLRDAQEQVERRHFREQPVVVVSRRGWPPGLMGPLASQLSERYHRPAIALALSGGQAIGSGRSVPTFNLLQALQACEALLMRFGGHALACGLTVEEDRIETVRAALNAQAQQVLGRGGLARVRAVDLEIPLAAFAPRWVGETQRFAPFGQGNPPPTALVRGVSVDVRSPQTGRVTDGERRLAARGRWNGLVRGAHYDVVVTPRREGEDVVLTVTEAKVAVAAAP